MFTLSLGSTIFAVLFAGVLFFLYKCFLKPYLAVIYYKKQGGAALFHWQLLSYFQHFKNARERRNFYYLYKDTFRRNPQAKFLVENFGSQALLVILDPEMIKNLFQRHEIYQKNKEVIPLFLDLSRGTTFFEEEETWKRGRKILSSAFNFEFIKEMLPVIVDVTQEQFGTWVKNDSLKDTILFEKLANITGEVTGRIFFGTKFSDQKIDGIPLSTIAIHLAYEIFNETFDIFSIIFGSQFPRTNILPRHKKLNRMIKAVRSRCKEMIKEVEKSAKKEPNLLNRLLELRNSGNQENAMDDEEVAGQFIGLFGAGTDSTANLVNSSIYYLCRYPEVFKKVKEEVDREFNNPKSLTVDDLNKMDYTTAFLKEALRLGVGCLFYRIAVKDDNLCGVEIKKGTLVNVIINVVQTSERYYSKPEEFIPERWLPNSPSNQDPFKSEPYSYIPFAIGPKNCLGQHLAVVEAKILIGLLLKTFNFKIPDDYNLTLVQGAVLEPLQALPVTLEVKDKSYLK